MTNPTLMRLRGNLGLRSTSANADAVIALGIIEAREAPATDTPNPLLFPDDDWVWFWYSVTSQALPVGDQAWANYERIVIDSRGMRRLDDNKRLLLIASAIGTTSAQLHGGCRYLLKE